MYTWTQYEKRSWLWITFCAKIASMQDGPRSMEDLLSSYEPQPMTKGSIRHTERGILLERFALMTGRRIGYIAYRLTNIPTADLYALEKQCDQYKGPWSKAFFGALKVRK